MKRKRILSFLLAVVLVITMLPTSVQAAKGGKLIALTFDDGPHSTYTTQLLDGLKARGVHVTFFQVGSNAASKTSIVQRAYDEGHEIGNHSYSHPNLNTLSASGVQSELNRTAAVLDQVCGSGTDYLVRPPYGNANTTVLSSMNAPAIIWSVDTNDWKYRDSNHVYNHIINNAYDGAIVLCHDIYSTTVSGALRAVDVLLARGYEFVTVSELYRRRGVTLQDGVKYYSCSNNGTDLGPVEKPVISYEPVNGGIRVTITSPSGAPVYYTLNGSRFTQQSTRYTGSFVVQCPVKIQAVAAFKLNGGRSETATCEVNLLPCAAPKITIENNKATISCSTSGAPIYYTVNGNAATTSSSRYTGAISVTPGTTVRANAGGGNYFVSDESKLHYSVNENLFTDVFPNDWYYSAIDELATIGLMNGVGNNSFAPNADTTRAMLVTMLYRYSGEKLEEGWSRTNTFTDVADGEWYAEAIEWAYRNGVVEGYPDNTFRHSQAITRQEMAKMVTYFLAYRGIALDTETDCRGKFADGTKISDWAMESVNAIVASGLMIGDSNGNFNPLKSAARAETATVIVRLIDQEPLMDRVPEETPDDSTDGTPEDDSSAEVPEDSVDDDQSAENDSSVETPENSAENDQSAENTQSEGENV